MDKVNRIKTEQDRLIQIFSDLDDNELQVARGLISQAAFMLITLEDLQEAIENNGSVGEYQNGEHQHGKKQSAELQAYNQTLRSYNAVIGKLLKIVPQKTTKTETEIEKWERIRKEEAASRSTPEELEQWHKEFCALLNADREKEKQSEAEITQDNYRDLTRGGSSCE